MEKVTVTDVRIFNKNLSKCAWWANHKNVFLPFDDEEDEIKKYNNQRGIDINHVISLGCPFEGVIGNPLTADIIVVSSNPSTPVKLLKKTVLEILPQLSEERSESEKLWKKYEEQCTFIQNPDAYKNEPFPAYNLDPNFQGVLGRYSGPYGYWSQALVHKNSLMWEAFAECDLNEEQKKKIIEWLSKHIAFLEVFGYHSAHYKDDVADQDKWKFPHINTCNRLFRQSTGNASSKMFLVTKEPSVYWEKFQLLRDREKAEIFYLKNNNQGQPRLTRGVASYLRDYKNKNMFSTKEEYQKIVYPRAASAIIGFIQSMVGKYKYELSFIAEEQLDKIIGNLPQSKKKL